MSKRNSLSRAGYIYLLTDSSNGKIYIGQARNVLRRMTQYRNLSKIPKNQKSHRPIERAVLGTDFDMRFSFEIIDSGTYTDAELNDLERKRIIEYNAMDPEIGYNIRIGGGVSGYSDSYRTLMKMTSTKKKMIVSYDTVTEYLFRYWSCASAAEYIPIGAENIATCARKCHRAMHGRYYIFYADAALCLSAIDSFICKRTATLESLTLHNSTTTTAAKIQAIQNYVIAELEAARLALKYSQHQGVAGNVIMSDNIVDEIINRYIENISSFVASPTQSDLSERWTKALYLYDIENDTITYYNGGARDVGAKIDEKPAGIQSAAVYRRRLRRRYYVYFADQNRRTIYATRNNKHAHATTPAYLAGLAKIPLT